MQAVILAAGKGTRLRPLTETIPKPMLPLGGKPLLAHTLEALPKEVDEAIIVVNYLAEKITEHFGNRYGRLKLTYVTQGEKKGTGAALRYARPHLKPGHFLLLNSDDLYAPGDLAKVAMPHASILVTESKNPERFGVCVLDSSGNLDRIIEKPKEPPCNLVTVGAYVLPHDIFDEPEIFMPNGEMILAEQVGALAKRIPIKVVPVSSWMPVNSLEEYEEAKKKF